MTGHGVEYTVAAQISLEPFPFFLSSVIEMFWPYSNIATSFHGSNDNQS